MYPHSVTRSFRTGLLLTTLAYSLFVIYGSLVPLEYRYLPLDEAVDRFRNLPFLKLGIGSRADWVANILLFVPLSFLWLGLLWPRRPSRRLPVSLAVWMAAVALSLVIEFTQLYFPQRTVSQNDLLAEAIGASIGIALWWWQGPRFMSWVAGLGAARGRTQVAEYLLWGYLGGLFLYNLLPLDLTISPVELYHKWQQGALILVPFSKPMDDFAQLVYALVTDVAIWVPVSLLWVLSGRKGPIQALKWTVATAVVLEVAQLFVYSRVSDVTDLLMAFLGAWLGVRVAAVSGYSRTGQQLPDTRVPVRRYWIFGAVLVWILILALVFWYPFDFRLERGLLRERLPMLMQAPFRSYYFGTEFRAVTELLHKVLFFVPLGALLALGRLGLQPGPVRSLYSLVAVALLLGVPFLIEMGQLALPDKYPGSTDWLLEVVGSAVGFWGGGFIYHRIRVPGKLGHLRQR